MARKQHPHRHPDKDRSRGWLSSVRESLFGLLTLSGALVLAGVITWLAVEGLRALGQWWFIPLPSGQYIHLTNNRINNHMALAGPVLLWLLGLYLVWDQWHDQVGQHQPKRLHKRRRRQPSQAGLPAPWLKLAWPCLGVTAGCFLLTLPGMRTYEVMTAHALHRQALWSWAPQSWPLKDLTCLSRSEGSKGTVFWAFHFKGEPAFSTVGLTQKAMDRVLIASGVRLSEDGCR